MSKTLFKKDAVFKLNDKYLHDKKYMIGIVKDVQESEENGVITLTVTFEEPKEDKQND